MIAQLAEEDFRNVVVRGLPVLQLIYVGLLGGVLSLLGFEYVMSQTVIPPSIPQPQPLDLMSGFSYIHAFVAVAMGMLAGFMPTLALPSSFLNPSSDRPGLTAASLFARFRVIRIVQLIAIETVAIVGLLVCMVGIKTGVVREFPLMWLNLISTVVFGVYVYRVFPTEEKWMALFHRLRV